MKIRAVKGTRDFYPAEMAVHNWIVDGWKRASIRNGFEEYDGPIFEYLKMYQVKSGDEIAEQLFSLQDRGGRDLAIRPEITPTLARMVNQKINSLAKPIKWFSVPRLCRAERPQKGRLREFYQWNIDIIGVDHYSADAEIIFTALDYLRMVGLTNKDIQVKISSRDLWASYLRSLGVPDKNLGSVYAVIDKKSKVPAEIFERMLLEQVSDKTIANKILEFMSAASIPDVETLMKAEEEEFIAWQQVKNVLNILDFMGVGDFCVFDPSIVRGLAYYTGVVFEIYDIVGELRAICGGGRFDNLLHDFGGPKIAAAGMGMGDCVLEILLREKGLLGEQVPMRQLDYFVTFADKLFGSQVYQVAAEVRSKGFSASFSYKPLSGLSKQLKEASAQKAKKCIIIGQECFENNQLKQLKIKDMATGEQELVKLDEFLNQLQD